MRSSEWIAFVYFAVLGIAAWVRPLPSTRRLSTFATAATMCIGILLVARVATPYERDWAPLVMILVGYYLSGRFFIEPSERLERWLMSWDRRLFGDPAAAFAAWPPAAIAVLETAYFGTFLVLPVGCAILFAGGHEAAVNRYWTIVIAAEFGAFGPLAFVQTRPPWWLEIARQQDAARFRRLGLSWVRTTSHCANTFPSGHAAGSLGVAFGVLPVMPAAGSALLVVALLICTASVVGRYHYLIDVVSGVALAVAVTATVFLLGV